MRGSCFDRLTLAAVSSTIILASSSRATSRKGRARFEHYDSCGGANASVAKAIALALSTAVMQAGWPQEKLVPDMGGGALPPAPTDHWIDSGRHRVNAGQDAPR